MASLDGLRAGAERMKRIYQETPDSERSFMTVHRDNLNKFKRLDACEHCGNKEAPVYNWAKKTDSEYTRNREDYLYLCRKCHHKYDNISEKLWAKRKRAEWLMVQCQKCYKVYGMKVAQAVRNMKREAKNYCSPACMYSRNKLDKNVEVCRG